MKQPQTQEFIFNRDALLHYFADIYYCGELKALDDVNQDVSDETDEYLKYEAKEYAEFFIKKLESEAAE